MYRFKKDSKIFKRNRDICIMFFGFKILRICYFWCSMVLYSNRYGFLDLDNIELKLLIYDY